MGHAAYTGTARETRMARTLFAVDELSGLITATALVKPTKSVHDVEAKSVLKKMKDKAFAKGVSREDVTLGAQELGVDLEQHTQFVIGAMREVAATLGLAGAPANPSAPTA
jgi:predicted hydrolase (HD superfamily)